MRTVVCAGLLCALWLFAGTRAEGLTSEQRQEYLDAHNDFRRKVDPTAADMRKMRYNYDLEKMAEMWADGCVYEHGDPNCTAKPFSSTGQNMFASTALPTPQRAVKAWYDEVNDYTFDTMVCAEGQQCGHYTQVVWSMSTQVGCGIAECEPLSGTTWEKGYLVVCNYGPAGNYVGNKPYQTGEPCSGCGAFECEDKLCIDTHVNYSMPASAPETQMKCDGEIGGSGGTNTTQSEIDSGATFAALPCTLVLFTSTILALWTK